MKKQVRTVSLTTPYEADPAQTEIPFSEYPRPMLRRDSYLCLNGVWKFDVITKKNPIKNGKIKVPFPPESRLSGIERITQTADLLRYRRALTLPDGFIRGRVILHFGAVDQQVTVVLNGRRIGSHEGGYLPFSFDITSALRPEEKQSGAEQRRRQKEN